MNVQIQMFFRRPVIMSWPAGHAYVGLHPSQSSYSFIILILILMCVLFVYICGERYPASGHRLRMMFVSKLFKEYHGITVQEYGNTMVWFVSVHTSVTVE